MKILLSHDRDFSSVARADKARALALLVLLSFAGAPGGCAEPVASKPTIQARQSSKNFGGGEGRFQAACSALKKKQYKLAVHTLLKLDRVNDGKGQTILGLLHEKGLGVKQDFSKALTYYRKAAKQGIPEAESNLGHLLLRLKSDVVQDSKKATEEALDWLERAANHGILEAQVTMGKLLNEGRRLPINNGKAAYYLHRAAQRGSREAQRMLDNIPQLNEAHQALLRGGAQYQTGMENLTRSWVGYADIVNNLNAASSYSRK